MERTKRIIKKRKEEKVFTSGIMSYRFSELFFFSHYATLMSNSADGQQFQRENFKMSFYMRSVLFLAQVRVYSLKLEMQSIVLDPLLRSIERVYRKIHVLASVRVNHEILSR